MAYRVYRDIYVIMKQLIVRNFPDAVHKDLKRMALEADTSLAAMVIQILTAAVEKARERGKIKGGQS